MSGSSDRLGSASLQDGTRGSTAEVSRFPLGDGSTTEADALVAVIRRLSAAHSLDEVMAVTTHAARTFVAADGVTFVLRDGDLCYYADEDAIAPLWKGHRFPMSSCISGWVMEHRRCAVIPDITKDERIPQDAYRPTFVKSLAMVPIRQDEPLGAMGAYWATARTPTSQQVERLQTIANAAALAVAFVQRSEVKAELEHRASMLDALLKYVPEGISIARAPDVKIERVSAQGLEWMQRAEREVTGIEADLHPAIWQVLNQEGTRLLSPRELPLTRAVMEGDTIKNERLNLRLPNGELLPILCNAGPIRGASGEITGGIIAWRDISDLVKLESERQLLVRELDHRLKNVFAMLAAMVTLTARNSQSVGEMAAALTGRISALGTAHDLIRPAIGTASAQGETLLQALLEQLLGPHLNPLAPQCRLSGPVIRVGVHGATNLAMIVHELATNAVKYGALSTPQGEVCVTWRDHDGSLELSWEEDGGPLLTQEPKGSGFGSKLINTTVKRQLAGAIAFDWQASGLKVAISIPLASLQE